MYICVSLELSVIVLSGSIPTYKPLWDRFVKPRLHTRASDRSYGSDLGKSGAIQHKLPPNVSVYQGLGNYPQELRFAPVGAVNIAGGNCAAIAHSPSHRPNQGSSEGVREECPETGIPPKLNMDSSCGIQVTETVKVEWTQHANESHV